MTSMHAIFLKAAQLDVPALEAAGPVGSFQLGCELGGLALMMLSTMRAGRSRLTVSVPEGLVDRARLAATELGCVEFRTGPAPSEPGRIQVEIAFL